MASVLTKQSPGLNNLFCVSFCGQSMILTALCTVFTVKMEGFELISTTPFEFKFGSDVPLDLKITLLLLVSVFHSIKP